MMSLALDIEPKNPKKVFYPTVFLGGLTVDPNGENAKKRK